MKEDKQVYFDKKDLIDKLKEQEEIILEYQEKIDSLCQEIKYYRNYANMYYSVTNSTMWKITEPFRIILDSIKKTVRKHRFSFLIYKGLASLKNDGLEITIERVKKFLKGEKYQAPALKKLRNIKIENFNELLKYLGDSKQNTNYKVILPEIIKDYEGKRVVALISHEGSLTGAPVVVFHFAKFLKDKGYAPILLLPKAGKIIEEFSKENIPTIVYPNLYLDNFVFHARKLFEFIVANTILSGPIIKQLLHTDTPVVWWIHEAKASYKHHLNIMPKYLTNNICVYTGGDYAKNILLEKQQNYSAETLLYYLPDFLNEFPAHMENKKHYTFACIGTIEERKAQHILAKAIELMNPEVRDKCQFIFVGRSCYGPISEVVQNIVEKYPRNVKHIEELTQFELKQLYQEIDCLVCPSFDDPMPVVVTDFLCLSKQVICYSNGVGTADILRETNAGILYHQNDSKVLSKVLEDTFRNRLDDSKLLNLRKAYEKYFSREAFENSLERVLLRIEDFKNMESKIDVSIIIPTYNAELDLKELLPLLKNQVNINDLEIVIVDSGSMDKTMELCKQFDVKLIEITQEEFSHSYSRNLGARAAKNSILVFMTQDARPTSDEWLASFVKPLFTEGVAAVCCKEKCPDNIELYYKICSNIHSSFLMMDNGDRIADISACENEIDLRRNGNLNDIANAIRKDIFNKFEYRFDYAEDLDLGIRLLKDGYRIAFLSSVEVLHGHNRRADYYMKRLIVETLALDKILKNNTPSVSDFSDVLTAYVVINTAAKTIKSRRNEDKNILLKEYSDLLCNTSGRMISEYFADNKNKNEVMDEQIDGVITLLFKNSNTFQIDLSITEHLNYFYNTYVYQFAKDDDTCNIDDVCNAMKKQFAAYLGEKLAHISVDSELYPVIQNLTKGV